MLVSRVQRPQPRYRSFWRYSKRSHGLSVGGALAKSSNALVRTGVFGVPAQCLVVDNINMHSRNIFMITISRFVYHSGPNCGRSLLARRSSPPMNYWPAALPEIQHFFAYSWFNLAPCSHLLYTWLFVIFSATLAININHLRINVFDVSVLTGPKYC